MPHSQDDMLGLVWNMAVVLDCLPPQSDEAAGMPDAIHLGAAVIELTEAVETVVPADALRLTQAVEAPQAVETVRLTRAVQAEYLTQALRDALDLPDRPIAPLGHLIVGLHCLTLSG